MSKATDWERIERDYRAGVKTLREIASEHAITHGAIAQKAKRLGWERDLQAKIKAKADALLSKSALSKELTKDRADSERVVVEANAQAVASVAIRHRTDLSDLRDVALALLAELRGAGEHADTLDQIAEMLGDPEADENRLRQALNKAISLPSRVGAIKALAETITKLIDAERTAWKLDDAPDDAARGKTLTDAERASRLATILHRAREKAPPPAEITPPAHARH